MADKQLKKVTARCNFQNLKEVNIVAKGLLSGNQLYLAGCVSCVHLSITLDVVNLERWLKVFRKGKTMRNILLPQWTSMSLVVS